MSYKQYSVVKVVGINREFTESELQFGNATPKVGDIATIIEVYKNPTLGYELESSNEHGITNWLITFLPSDVELELVHENV